MPELRAGTSRTPSTWRSISIRRYCSSSASSSSVLQYMTENPWPTKKSSTPRAIVVKNGFVMSDTTSAMVLVRLDRSWRASALGT